MKKLTCVVLGYGDRGERYSDYARVEKDELEIVGVIDPNPVRRESAKDKFSLREDMLFNSLEDFFKKGVKCDFVINATMDELHYATAMALLDKGYNILLEKPVTANPKELLDIKNKAEERGLKVVVCHVLRYTPFYSTIKNIIDSGKIGKVVSLQLNEHVWYGHFVNAYVRGKWNNEKACGSGLLLAKCCHDTDLICWLNNITEPVAVSSFGSKGFFTEENAPKGSAKRCHECAVENCMFNAKKFEIEKNFCPMYTWGKIQKPLEEITDQEKEEFLKTSSYGECVFKTDMDIVDRQCVSVNFKNGSIATLNLVGGTSAAGRHIHAVCEYGEIVGYVEQNKILLRVFDKENICFSEEEIDFSASVDLTKEDNSIGGHYGGDYYIMRDLIRFLNGEPTSSATTVISDSISGHMVVYCAEKSRKTATVVGVKDFENDFIS